MKNKIINLTNNGGRWDWEVIDCITGEKTHYHTNQNGDGVWIGEDYQKQIIGLCQFRLHQKTKSGVRKAVKTRFE